MECFICGKTINLRLLAGKIVCKKCSREMPRGRCAAERNPRSAKGRKGIRCGCSTFRGAELCSSHQQAGYPPREWEECPVCGLEKIVGEECPYKDPWHSPEKLRELGELRERRSKREEQKAKFREVVEISSLEVK